MEKLFEILRNVFLTLLAIACLAAWIAMWSYVLS